MYSDVDLDAMRGEGEGPGQEACCTLHDANTGSDHWHIFAFSARDKNTYPADAFNYNLLCNAGN